MFQSPQIAENLSWHANDQIKDGKLRRPVDSPAWHLVDNKWPDFGQEPRNLQLALNEKKIHHAVFIDIWA